MLSSIADSLNTYRKGVLCHVCTRETHRVVTQIHTTPPLHFILPLPRLVFSSISYNILNLSTSVSLVLCLSLAPHKSRCALRPQQVQTNFQ
jgi:hypothetical protein